MEIYSNNRKKKHREQIAVQVIFKTLMEMEIKTEMRMVFTIHICTD